LELRSGLTRRQPVEATRIDAFCLRLPYLLDEQQARHGPVVSVLASYLGRQSTFPIPDQEVTFVACENDAQGWSCVIGGDVMKSGRVICLISKIYRRTLIYETLQFRGVSPLRSFQKFLAISPIFVK